MCGMVLLRMRWAAKINDIRFDNILFGSLGWSLMVSFLSRPNSNRSQGHRRCVTIDKACNGFSDESGGKEVKRGMMQCGFLDTYFQGC